MAVSKLLFNNLVIIHVLGNNFKIATIPNLPISSKYAIHYLFFSELLAIHKTHKMRYIVNF